MTGNDLRALREQAGVRLRDLALELDRDASALSKIETGHKPVPEELPAEYDAVLRRITRDRAVAFGLLEPSTSTITA